MVTYIIR
ncbi:uncharacterized protein FFM5_04128 [Fusarium fujikuroi]|nr:uncharacterized protein FFM5_04128 [Fusarium fujikuroi]